MLRLAPLSLALAMLSAVVLAGLVPVSGVVSASSNCTYGNCPASSPFPIWAVSAAVVVVLLALILALLMLRRSRRRPPAAAPPAPGAAPESSETGSWSEGPPPSGQTWDETPETPGPEAENEPPLEPESGQ
jgi:hypothetical protein